MKGEWSSETRGCCTKSAIRLINLFPYYFALYSAQGMVALEIVKLPSMSKREIRSLVGRQVICRIAFRGNEFPYLAPFQYVTIGGILYFHFTNYGKKIKMLSKHPHVCVEIEEYKPDLSSYRFVSLRGKLKLVSDPKERTQAIRKFASEGGRKLSRNFLVAHGFQKKSDWSSFDPDKPLVIMKLAEVYETVGLRSF